MKNTSLIKALVPACLFLFLIASACHKSKSSSNGGPSCGDGSPAQTAPVIKGPAVGVAGNNHDNPFRSLAIDPNNPQIVYAGSECNGIFKSTDGGNTWQWIRAGLYY